MLFFLFTLFSNSSLSADSFQQPRSQFLLLPQENALPLRPTAGVGLSALPSGLDGFILTATELHLQFLLVQPFFYLKHNFILKTLPETF